MKASDLIKALHDAIYKSGDLEVLMFNEYGDHVKVAAIEPTRPFGSDQDCLFFESGDEL